MATAKKAKTTKKAAAKKTAAKAPKAAAAKKTATKAPKAAAAKKTAAKAPKAAAAKKTAAKSAFMGGTAPKQSPLKGMSLDAWIAGHASGWQAEAVEKIVSLVKKAAPDATTAIKWGQPVFDSNGPFAYVKPHRAHVTFGFWRGTEIADPKGLLDGKGDRMTHMKITGVAQIDEAAILAMVKDAVRLNREKGSPTIRANR